MRLKGIKNRGMKKGKNNQKNEDKSMRGKGFPGFTKKWEFPRVEREVRD
jgi:hypothetical protein